MRGDDVWLTLAEFLFVDRLCWRALKLVCVSVQRFDHMQLCWKLGLWSHSSNSHYKLILEPAAM